MVTSTLNHPEPKSGLEGKFSVAFPLALALLQRKVGLADFTDERVNDSRVTALMKKITVRSEPRLQEAGGNEVTAKLSIKLQDDQTLERLATLAQGKSQEWISEGELNEKFRQCARMALPVQRAEEALACLLRLEDLGRIGELMGIVGRGKHDG